MRYRGSNKAQDNQRHQEEDNLPAYMFKAHDCGQHAPINIHTYGYAERYGNEELYYGVLKKLFHLPFKSITTNITLYWGYTCKIESIKNIFTDGIYHFFCKLR